MNRKTRLVLQGIAVGVIIVGLALAGPGLLRGLEAMLHEVRQQWWLLILVAVAVGALVLLRKKR